MAELVAGFLGPAIEVVKWVAKPIIRQLNYLCCFTTNIKSLKDEAGNLENATGGLQGRVNTERDNLQVILPEVETWLANSKHMKDQTTTILDQVPDVESGCLKLGARFSLSKTAKKTTDAMKELRDKCKFDAISQAGPSAATQEIPLGKAYEFESRKQIEQDIITIMRRKDVKMMMGICGMGGLGKTTMAKRIINRVLKEHIFQEAVMAVISEQVDKSKIQLEIGGQLGLNLKDETSEDVRRKKLHARLTDDTKRILLVLDDIWKGLEVEDLGIPRDSKACTILITSRNRDALSEMGCGDEDIFGMKVLSEEDAWFLFREGVGTCVDDTKLKSIGKKVVKKCKGLPVAIAAVGAALKHEKDESIWKDALRRLSRSSQMIPDFIAESYNALKVSYDFLRSNEAKSLVLLCCLFREDADIPLEYLTFFCMGLGIFEGIRNLEEARDGMSRLIKILKSRSLLLDSDSEGHVRMHDVVRDVCIFIARQEGYIGGNDCKWISSSLELVGETSKLPTGSGFPNLRLLFLSRNYFSDEKELIKLDSAFVEGIRDLSVLCIQNYWSLRSLPAPTTQSLTNLNTLVLVSCPQLKTISVVGELVNLEILICRDCDSIEELPLEIKGLNHLKLLELTGCSELERIGRGIISSLVGLEELKMLDSFNKWEAEDSELKQNAKLRELEALTNLRCLEIEIEDNALAAANMHLSSKIDRFYVRIGSSRALSGFDKTLTLELEGEACLGDWIEMQLLRDTEFLNLLGNGANNVDLAKSQNIRWLELRGCETIKNIVRTSSYGYGGATVTVFPSIEHLELYSLPKLEEIWDGPISSNSFKNLKELQLISLEALQQLWKSSIPNRSSVPLLFTNLSSIEVGDCPGLRNLGQLSIAAGKDCLPQLEKLHIWRCEMMEQVFLWNKEDDENTNNSESPNPHSITKVFPKLKEVRLRNLPNLATFYQGIGGIEFPLLRTLEIKECPKMKFIGSDENSGGSSSADIDDDDSAHLFCQVSFANLKKLEVDHWNPLRGHKILLSLFNGLEELSFSTLSGSMSLFSSSIAENLVNLRILIIEKCDEMLKVIEDKEEEEKVVSGTSERALLFPKLEKLELEDLSKLVTFCGWKCDVELPSLRKLVIKRCPDMENFSLGILTAPNLEAFTTDVENNLENGVKVSFDSLKKLAIRENENPFYGHKLFIFLFNGLKEVQVFGYKGSMSLFTSSITRNLVSLQVLIIRKCHKMVKVIEDKEEEENVVSGTSERALLFPKLKKLELEDLSKLVTFCGWKCDVELPSLRKVVIKRCPDMENFSLGILSAPNLEAFTTDVENNLEIVVKVSFDSLKKLEITENENPFYGHKLFISLFNGLKELQVFGYKGSMSLFTSSITRNLVSLQVLIISKCNEMVKVIEDEEEEEKVASGDERTILFLKLKELCLFRLPKLVTFCECKCDVELPSLKKLVIINCPDMKSFTVGSIAATPNLDNGEIDWEDIGGTKDLNDALQQVHLAREKEKQEEEEEQERKGEIEEEQIDSSSAI